VFVPEAHGPDRLRYQPHARGGGFGSALAGGLLGGAAVLGASHYATLGAAAVAVATAPFYQVALLGAPLGYLGYQGVAQFTRRAADRREVERMNGAIAERYNTAVAHYNVMTAMGHDPGFDQEAALHTARTAETRVEHRRVGPFGWFRSKWTQVVDGNGNVLGTTDREPHWWEFRERGRMRKGVAGAQRLPVHLTRTPRGSSAASFRPAVPAAR
jgi:hypothetical protein